MNTSVNSMNWIGIISNAVSVIAFIVILIGFKGKQLPIYNERLFFYLLFLLGFAMSTLAGFRDFPDGKFNLPPMLLRSLMLMGFAAFAVLAGIMFKIKLPVNMDYSLGISILSIIIIGKWILTRSYLLLKLFTNTMG